MNGQSFVTPDAYQLPLIARSIPSDLNDKFMNATWPLNQFMGIFILRRSPGRVREVSTTLAAYPRKVQA